MHEFSGFNQKITKFSAKLAKLCPDVSLRFCNIVTVWLSFELLEGILSGKQNKSSFY